jgi:archaemetzincin
VIDRRARLLLATLAFASVGLSLARAGDDDDGDEKPMDKKGRLQKLAEKREALWSKHGYDETGFERMAPPKEGEWLDAFEEDGQTFDDFKAGCKNKRRAGRETIYIRLYGPLGDRACASIGPIVSFTEAYFQLPVKVLDEQPIPKKAYVKKRRQYDEAPIMKVLKKERTDDALVWAALCDKDLFSDDLNFVFGVGSLQERVGVYSLIRFSEGDGKEDRVYRRRAYQLVSHELGHILSLEHCVYYKCLMNGSNSLDESDEAPCHECPVCEEKLRWNVGFDPIVRYKALAAFYEKDGQQDEAKWCAQAAARLEKRKQAH